MIKSNWQKLLAGDFQPLTRCTFLLSSLCIQLRRIVYELANLCAAKLLVANLSWEYSRQGIFSH